MWCARESENGSKVADIRISYVHVPGIRCGICGQIWAEFSCIYDDPPQKLVSMLAKLKGPQSNAIHADLTAAAVALGYPPLFPGAALGAATVTLMKRKSLSTVLWHGGRMFVDTKEAEVTAQESGGRLRFKRCEGRFELAELVPLILKPTPSHVLCSTCGFRESEPDPMFDLIKKVGNSLEINGCVLTPGRRWFSDDAKICLEQRGWENIEFFSPETSDEPRGSGR
jgi:hypothetical protein